MPLKLFVIKPVEEREQGHDHPVLDAILARPHYRPGHGLEAEFEWVRERPEPLRRMRSLTAS